MNPESKLNEAPLTTPGHLRVAQEHARKCWAALVTHCESGRCTCHLGVGGSTNVLHGCVTGRMLNEEYSIAAAGARELSPPAVWCTCVECIRQKESEAGDLRSGPADRRVTRAVGLPDAEGQGRRVGAHERRCGGHPDTCDCSYHENLRAADESHLEPGDMESTLEPQRGDDLPIMLRRQAD